MSCTKIYKQLVNDIFWQRYENGAQKTPHMCQNDDIFKLNTLFQRLFFVI